VLDNISLAPYHQSFPPEQDSAPVGSTSEHSGSSEFWLGGAPAPSPENSKPRKPRLKPRIELAPDQPPTTQGKPRARVYVACLQWFVSSIQALITFPDSHLAELERYVVMAQSLSAITVGAVPMETTSVITTLSQSVVVPIKPLVLVNAWREMLEMISIKLVFPLVGVAQLILPQTQTKQTVNKRVMT
jgi:hypothetical protein